MQKKHDKSSIRWTIILFLTCLPFLLIGNFVPPEVIGTHLKLISILIFVVIFSAMLLVFFYHISFRNIHIILIHGYDIILSLFGLILVLLESIVETLTTVILVAERNDKKKALEFFIASATVSLFALGILRVFFFN